MKISINGNVRELTPDEIAQRQAEAEEAEREEWQNISYDDAVNREIRKRYPQQDVEAILNNYLAFPENPEHVEEFRQLQQYRVECKAFVKQMIEKHQGTAVTTAFIGGDSQ